MFYSTFSWKQSNNIWLLCNSKKQLVKFHSTRIYVIVRKARVTNNINHGSVIFKIYFIIYTCAFPSCHNVFCIVAIFNGDILYAHLLHSGSQTAAPRHTCLSWSGRAAGLQSGMCYEKRQQSSYTEAAPCLDSPHCAKGWKCHTLDCAWNL